MEIIKKEIQYIVDLYKSGDLIKAEQLGKKILINNPKAGFIYNLLGLILNKQKKLAQAVEYYEKGIEADPTFAMLYNNLGLIHKYKKNYEKAEDNYKKCLEKNEETFEAHNNLGDLYVELNKYDEAILCFKRSLSINPKFPISHYNLGIAYKSTGKFEKAEEHLIKAIQLYPKFYIAHRSLGHLRKFKKNDTYIKDLKKIYTEKEISINGKSELAFTLGKAFDDIKNYSEAYKYYKQGNKLRRKDINFSIKNEKKDFTAIKKIFTKNLLSQYKKKLTYDVTPIFILGMPRSGTTLVEQIVSRHDKVFAGDEINFFNELIKKNFYKNNAFSSIKLSSETSMKFDKIGIDYTNKLKNLCSSKNIVTDKLPVNFKWIGFIKLILPNAKIINCIRNSKDNCLSIYKNYFVNVDLNYAYDFSELVQYYNLYQDLMLFWKNKFPNSIIDVKYENIIKNPDKEIKRIIKLCDLNWDKKCLKFYDNVRPIKTASDSQARKKIYKTSVNIWKNYNAYLKKYFLKLKS